MATIWVSVSNNCRQLPRSPNKTECCSHRRIRRQSSWASCEFMYTPPTPGSACNTRVMLWTRYTTHIAKRISWSYITECLVPGDWDMLVWVHRCVVSSYSLHSCLLVMGDSAKTIRFDSLQATNQHKVANYYNSNNVNRWARNFIMIKTELLIAFAEASGDIDANVSHATLFCRTVMHVAKALSP